MIIQTIMFVLLVLWLLYTEKKINDTERDLLDIIGKLIDRIEKGGIRNDTKRRNKKIKRYIRRSN